MSILKKCGFKKPIQDITPSSLSQRASNLESSRSEWKENLKRFVQIHFVLLLLLILLFGIVCLLFFWGKLKLRNSVQQESPTEILKKQNAQLLIKELNEKKDLPSLTIKNEIIVSQFKLQNPGNTPVSIHIQYPGSTTLGIDLRKLKENHLQFNGDTLILHMPAIEILTPTHENVNDIQKKILIQTGEWSRSELNTLFKRANLEMIRQSISEDECLTIAKENARKLLLNILHSRGYKCSIVSFEKKDFTPSVHAKYPDGIIPNDYNFYTTAKGQKAILYKNGSIIYYNDSIPLDQLYDLAEFCAISFIHPIQITLQLEKKKNTLFTGH